MKISKTEAIREIRASLLNAYSSTTPNPFFFMVGAGISVPSVPLAREITEELRLRAVDHRAPDTPPEHEVTAYSYWFEKALPSPIERARYLRKLIHGKPVTPACFNLAKLLAREHDGRPLFHIALTTNFDDFLTRGLLVLGVDHYTHSHPIALDQVDLEKLEERQVIHLHGSYKFYTCKNTDSEVGHSKRSEISRRVVTEFLSRLMPFRMPIIVGYGGRVDDVFMRVLCEKLKREQLPRNGYWFCHSPEEAEHLPSVILDHPNLRVVIDDKTPIDAALLFDELSSSLPGPSYQPRGGAIALAAALLNGETKVEDRSNSRPDPLLRALQEIVEVEEITQVGPPWTTVTALVGAGEFRRAWNILFCGEIEPRNDFESITLLSLLCVISRSLAYDRNLVRAINQVLASIDIKDPKLQDQAKDLKARIPAERPTENDSRPEMASECDCGEELTLFPEMFNSVDVACPQCRRLYRFVPDHLAVQLVSEEIKLKYLLGDMDR